MGNSFGAAACCAMAGNHKRVRCGCMPEVADVCGTEFELPAFRAARAWLCLNCICDERRRFGLANLCRSFSPTPTSVVGQHEVRGCAEATCQKMR